MESAVKSDRLFCLSRFLKAILKSIIEKPPNRPLSQEKWFDFFIFL